MSNISLIKDGANAALNFYNKNPTKEVTSIVSGAAGAATGAVIGNYLGDVAAGGMLIAAFVAPQLLPLAGAAFYAAPFIGAAAGAGVGLGVDALFKKILG